MVVNSTVTLCLKIAEKSHVALLLRAKRATFKFWTKVFKKTEAFCQTVLPDKISLNKTKIAGKCQKIYSNETFLGDFQTI